MDGIIIDMARLCSEFDAAEARASHLQEDNNLLHMSHGDLEHEHKRASEELKRITEQGFPDGDVAHHFHGPGKCVSIQVHRQAIMDLEQHYVDERTAITTAYEDQYQVLQGEHERLQHLYDRLCDTHADEIGRRNEEIAALQQNNRNDLFQQLEQQRQQLEEH